MRSTFEIEDTHLSSEEERHSIMTEPSKCNALNNHEKVSKERFNYSN